MINLPGESTREGVEVGAAQQAVAAALTLGASLYLPRRAAIPTALREVRRPPHAGRADLAYGFADGRGTVNLAAIYNGRMEDNVFDCRSFPTRVPRRLLDDYWLVNAAAAYKLQPGVELFGRRGEYRSISTIKRLRLSRRRPITAFAGLKLTFGGPDGIGAQLGKA